MIRDFKDFLGDFFEKIKSSRLFILSVIYAFMVFILGSKLFTMQMVNGKEAQDKYVQKIKKTVATTGARGNIYDRNGNLLAYNKLSYTVTITDGGYYKKVNDKNNMYYRLVQILRKHNENIEGDFLVAVDENGDFYYTTKSDAARLRFIADMYGLKSLDELDDKAGKYPSNISAQEMVDKKLKTYGLDKMTDSEGNIYNLSGQDKIDLINIRYEMGKKLYRRYEPTIISTNISEEAKIDIMENTASLIGVDVENDTLRVYNDAVYFSDIIGYTGKVPDEKLDELLKERPDYTLNDIVGRIGIEESMETTLQGTKGSKTMIVDNVGRIIETISEVESSAGNDVYLTIDKNLQIATYRLVEQQLAGVLASKIVNEDNPNTDSTDATHILIPVKDAYYQLIGNNVLDTTHFAKADASATEQSLNAKLTAQKENILVSINNELTSSAPTVMGGLPEDTKAYLNYIHSALTKKGIIKKDNIDTKSEVYQAWKNETTSLRDYLFIGISSGYIDTTIFFNDSNYSSAEDIYSKLVEDIQNMLKDDADFDKLVYKYLIRNNVVTGRELCLALFDQGILNMDEAAYAQLAAGNEGFAFPFFIDKISRIEITPAQLALDPCSAGAVVTDVNTGEVRALVSYPGYDNNRLANSMDVTYFNKLLEDESLPLYNNATQTKKAPGSTFKPITVIAGLEEHVINATDTVVCTGIYDTINPAIKCWIYPGSHGPESAVKAIQDSCNVYLAETGHRLSTDGNGEYSSELGIERLKKYATMFGLDHKSGVEIVETEPQISDINPEQSSIGQGNHAFANIQLARYVATIANQGTVFELSLLDKVCDQYGNVLQDYTPVSNYHVDISQDTWNNVREGMHRGIKEGSARKVFTDLNINIAGKTGTAQESKTRGNHAFFISFAPYESPEIAVTVNIPYGYSSTNAAVIGKNIYKYYYNQISLDYILNNSALDVSDVRIGD